MGSTLGKSKSSESTSTPNKKEVDAKEKFFGELKLAISKKNVKDMIRKVRECPSLVAQADKDGNTPLHLLVMCGSASAYTTASFILQDVKFAKKIRQSKSDVLNKKNKDGMSPFFLAASHKLPSFVELFHMNGAFPLLYASNAMNPSREVFRNLLNDESPTSLETLRCIMKCAAKYKEPICNGLSFTDIFFPLSIRAIKNKRYRFAITIFENADFENKSAKSYSALLEVCQNEVEDDIVVQFVRKLQSWIDFPFEISMVASENPLHLAAKNGLNKIILELLMAYPAFASYSTVDDDLCSVLHILAKKQMHRSIHAVVIAMLETMYCAEVWNAFHAKNNEDVSPYMILIQCHLTIFADEMIDLIRKNEPTSVVDSQDQDGMTGIDQADVNFLRTTI